MSLTYFSSKARVQGDLVAIDDEAMQLLKIATSDLILLSRNSLLFEKRLDQRMRQNYPKMLILKVQLLQTL